MRTPWWLCLPVLFTSCASSPDWNTRVGAFTYEQVVAERGAPARMNVLPDGHRQASWLIERGSPATVGHGMGGAFATRSFGDSAVKQEFPARPDRYLHLTFGPDGVLQSWQADQRTGQPVY